jgi:hypothetical protein
MSIKERFIFIWGSSLGFVVGTVLAALLYRKLGWWLPSEQRLKKFITTPSEVTNAVF